MEEPAAARQTVPDSSEGLETRIRARAYEIYLARGASEGSDLEDWLQAEREVIRTLLSSTETTRTIAAA